MFNKHLRILIIDPERGHSLLIEKMLNSINQYCVAVTQTVEEGLLLNRYGLKNFDVLIAPHSVLVLGHSGISRFKGFNIKNLLLYSCPSHHFGEAIYVKGQYCYRSGFPEKEILKEFCDRLVA